MTTTFCGLTMKEAEAMKEMMAYLHDEDLYWSLDRDRRLRDARLRVNELNVSLVEAQNKVTRIMEEAIT